LHRHFYLPYGEAARAPNVVVDGAVNGNTVLSLSHWPKSSTPWPLKADTSAAIVFRYLDTPAWHTEVGPVTNDHFDEDGLIGLFCMTEPEQALGMRDLLIDAAEAGDFAIYRDRRAARIAFSVSRLADPELSPWAVGAFPRSYPDYCAFVYARLLQEIGAMARDVEAHRVLWADEDALLDASEEALAAGEATLEEIAEIGLAVITVPADWPERPAHRFAQHRDVVIHPMAVHNRTHCNRIATLCGNRLSFTYRYESWVQMISRRPPPRVDLEGLAAALAERETDGRAWCFDGVEEITPRLYPESGHSTLHPDVFLQALADALAAGPPAWDPYDIEPAAPRQQD
jgi:hypothetical protein